MYLEAPLGTQEIFRIPKGDKVGRQAVRYAEKERNYSHEYLKGRMSPQLPGGPAIGLHHLRPRTFDMFSSTQPMHAWTRVEHWVETNQVASAIFSALKADNAKRMARLLHINGRQESFVDIRAILNCSLLEIFLHTEEELLMGLELAIRRIVKNVHSAINLGIEE